MIHICILIYICTWYRTICCAKYVRFQNSFGHWSSAEVIESLRNAFGLSKWRWWDFNKLKVPHCTLLHCDWWGESHISALWIAIFPEIWQFWTSRIPYVYPKGLALLGETLLVSPWPLIHSLLQDQVDGSGCPNWCVSHQAKKNI